MRIIWRNILVAMIVAAVLLPATAPAESTDSTTARRKPLKGSVARQLLLKHQLETISEGNLAALLRHNREEWESLTPDERDRYRRYALAFLEKNRQEQEELIRRHDELIKMSAEKREAYRRRAKWLQIVVASFTPKEREELQKLSPDDRARLLLERKAELVRQGKLQPDAPAPTSQPAASQAGKAEPTTQPAEKLPTTAPAED